MKKTLCLLGIIALTVTIAFSMTGCPDLAAFLNNNPDDNHGESNPNNNEPGNGNNNNGKTTDDKLSSVNDASNFLNEQTGGDTTDDPVVLSIEMDLGYMSSPASNWQKLLEAIDTAGKYVELDLYYCTMLVYANRYVFNLDYSIKTGKDKIVSIILPYEADIISNSSDTATTNSFRHFTNLESVSGAYVDTIGNYAFYNCSRLTKVSFPQTTTIGQSAFQGCTSLTDVSFPAATTIGNEAFRNCTSLRIARFHADPARNTSGHPLKPWLDNNVIIGDTTTPPVYVADPQPVNGLPCTSDSVIFHAFAFYGCISLETLDIRNAWNVYFAGNALGNIGETLDLYLYDDEGPVNGGICYGHPQLERFLGISPNDVSIKSIKLIVPNVDEVKSRIMYQSNTTGYPGIYRDIISTYGFYDLIDGVAIPNGITIERLD